MACTTAPRSFGELSPSASAAATMPRSGRGRLTKAQAYGENLVLTRTYRDSRPIGFSWRTSWRRGIFDGREYAVYQLKSGFPFCPSDGRELVDS